LYEHKQGVKQGPRATYSQKETIISIVKPTSCTIFEFIEYHSTCFGRSFRPSSGVQDCTHSIRYMSYRLADCLLAGIQRTCMTYTWCSVRSWTPDDGRKDRPKHV